MPDIDLSRKLGMESRRLEDCVVSRLAAWFCEVIPHDYDGVAHELAADDGCTVLRRVSDGQVFDVEISVVVRPRLTDAQLATVADQRERRLLEQAGQQRLPEVTADV